MSDDNNKSKTGDTARKIWLAGIGAYGRAFSEVQEGLTKATKGSTKVFEELVQKGEQLETLVTHKSKDAIEKMSDGLDLDERISKMRARLKRGGHEQDNMEERLDRLEAKLDEILVLLKPKKTATRKPRTAKKSPRKTAKAKKPTAKSTKK